MKTAAYYLDKARQCRRLAQAIGDDRAIESLTALAREFEAKAAAVELSVREVDHSLERVQERTKSADSSEPSRTEPVWTAL